MSGQHEKGIKRIQEGHPEVVSAVVLQLLKREKAYHGIEFRVPSPSTSSVAWFIIFKRDVRDALA